MKGSDAGRPSAFETIVYGGLVVGVLDFLDASIFFPLYYGIGFTDVWHSVAAGVMGHQAAGEGGWATAILGIFLHFVVAFCVAAVYFLGTRVLPIIVNWWIVSGLAYGVAVHFVMQYVVIPLSLAARTTPSTFRLAAFLNSVIGHALLVGLPIAFIANRSAKRN